MLQVIPQDHRGPGLTTTYWKPNILIRSCVGIYRKIDKTVKMYINSYQSIHTSTRVVSVLFSYCFQPYEHHFLIASFNVLVSQLLRRRQGKTRLSYTTRRKSYKNYFSSTPIASNLHLSIDQRFSFLEKEP